MRNVKTKRVLRPSISVKGYYRIDLEKNGKRTKYYFHRLVLKTFLPNLEEKKCVDHINGIRLAYTISNLRWSSDEENFHNRILSNRNTSGFKGVSWDNQKNKWRAIITYNKKKIHLG